MALKKILATVTLVCTLLVADVGVAQVSVPSSRFQHQSVESPDSTRPFAEPGVFNYDTQVFAPLEFTNGSEKEPHEGFFLTYERAYTNLSRGGQIGSFESSAVPVGSDWVWGNRFEFGWMSDDDDGWSVVYQKANGSFFSSGQDILIATPMLVTTDFSQFEINKMFRQSLSNGDYYEPYLGLKYFSLSDNTLQDTTTIFGGLGAFNRFKQNTTNSAVGFQVGGRYNARRGRYRMTTDVAIVTAYNQQRYFATDILTVGGAIGSTEFYDKSQSFLPALDSQFEFAYNLSRDFSLRTGVQLSYLWTGVARSNNLPTPINPNSSLGPGAEIDSQGIFDTRFVAAGFTFGVEWKR